MGHRSLRDSPWYGAVYWQHSIQLWCQPFCKTIGYAALLRPGFRIQGQSETVGKHPELLISTVLLRRLLQADDIIKPLMMLLPNLLLPA